MKWIKKTYLQCIPLHFGVFCLSFYCFFFLLYCVTTVTPFIEPKWRLVTSIWRGPGPVALRIPFFRRNSNLLQIFHLQPKRETSSCSLGDRLEKSFPNQIEPFVQDFEASLAFVKCLWPLLRLPTKGWTIRKVMGGGEGNFPAAGIFFRYQIPCMNFFRL